MPALCLNAAPLVLQHPIRAQCRQKWPTVGHCFRCHPCAESPRDLHRLSTNCGGGSEDQYTLSRLHLRHVAQEHQRGQTTKRQFVRLMGEAVSAISLAASGQATAFCQRSNSTIRAD